MRDEVKQGNDGASVPVCSRCDRSIEPGEKMFSMHVSLLKLRPNYSVQLIEQHHLSQFCFGCASMILTDAAITEKLITPITCLEEINGR
jgi:hypothetical protein